MEGIRFLTNEANKVEGLAYAGFETFRGSPYTSCARETGQNSRDAAAGKEPVKVSFDLLELDRKQVPFADQLQHSIECCLKAPHDSKTRVHLERARRTIAASTIKVLKIADLNTTGLTGPVDDPNSVFTALVKGDGVTNKADRTSAGSYGIGKNAAYAVSDLQTVIYSSRYVDRGSGTTRFAAQGRLRLVSHNDGEKKLSAEGYWGNPGFAAIENESQVPDWIARNDIGTSIFAIGFREQENWVDRMALSLATNFFLAIDRREIEFSLNGGSIRMNQSSFDGILSSQDLQRVAEDNDQLLELERAKRLMQCLRSDATEQHTISIPGLGEFTLHLLVCQGLPREVHILRNGIYICDNFAKFGQPMKQFPSTREFIAILEPATSEAGRRPSELLKQLENPAHDAFEPERIIDAAELRKAKDQIKTLHKRVREIIRSSASIEDIDESQLEELSHLFAAGGVGEPDNNPDAERDPDRFQYGAAQKSQPSHSPAVGGKGASERRHGPTKEQTPPIRSQSERGNISKASGSRATVRLEDVRSVMPDKSNSHVRTLFFTPEANGEVEIAVAAAGLGYDVNLALKGASLGKIVNGKLQTMVAAGQRSQVEVIFGDAFSGPIELSASGVHEMTAREGI
ncbi:MAG TPA: hypothetical protein VK814_07695 [Acidobacteriaceae bacterium]|jgi:hypothetical protein|nr:hypothetical protein [Acidobacteriaceae bacterium]